jgi:hypothetical protein
MTERAQKILETFLREPKFSKRNEISSLINVIREIVNEFHYYQCCEEEGVEDMVVDARVLYELANELEELK